MSEIELNGSLTTTELKKPHPPRLVGGVQMQNSPILTGHSPVCGGYKFGRDILGPRSPSPTPGPAVQGSRGRKANPYNFWLQNPAGTEMIEEICGSPSSSS